VSPVNARKQLALFIKKAKKTAAHLRSRIADAEMLRVLQERAKAGVEIKIIGRVGEREKD